MVGGDWNNTRYSQLKQINTRNVAGLKAAWISRKFDEGGTSRVTPVVSGGLMFVTAGRQVYALNAKTGARLWSYIDVTPRIVRIWSRVRPTWERTMKAKRYTEEQIIGV